MPIKLLQRDETKYSTFLNFKEVLSHDILQQSFMQWSPRFVLQHWHLNHNIQYTTIMEYKDIFRKSSLIHVTSGYLHTHPFNGPFPGLPRWAGTRKVKPIWILLKQETSEWQWHQLGHMQVCTSLQTDNHASTPPLIFYWPDALPAAQPTASKHWRHLRLLTLKYNYSFYTTFQRKWSQIFYLLLEQVLCDFSNIFQNNM